jgi:hypothetical protein
MIDLLLSGLALLVPGAGVLGVWGLVVKVAAKLGLGWITAATTGPIGGLIAKAGEGLIDLIVWAGKGVLGFVGTKLAEGVDHITKSVPATMLLLAVAWGAWTAGVGRAEPEPPPSAVSAPAKAVPKPTRAKPRADAPQINPLDWLDAVFR